jgi:hypothetical protein
MPSQEMPVKRTTASDARRVSANWYSQKISRSWARRFVNEKYICADFMTNFLFGIFPHFAPVLTDCDSNSAFIESRYGLLDEWWWLNFMREKSFWKKKEISK